MTSFFTTTAVFCANDTNGQSSASVTNVKRSRCICHLSGSGGRRSREVRRLLRSPFRLLLRRRSNRRVGSAVDDLAAEQRELASEVLEARGRHRIQVAVPDGDVG